jgi:2-polyprenyl-6-hydroxyphenyl methylase/3-demethylubiquinone-9 3-methyltransferase
MSAPSNAVEWHQRIGARFAERYSHSAAFRERLRLWSDLIDRHLAPETVALDAGCGPGVLAAVAARRCARVAALDASSNMIALARRRAQDEGVGNIEFHLGTIGDPALLAGCRFDAILCSSVLEYVEDLDAALDWLAARLAPGGALLVSMPNGGSFHRRAERIAFRLLGRPRYYAFVRHAPTPAQFAWTLRRCGLPPVFTEFYAGPAPLRRLSSCPRWSEKIEPLFVMIARHSESEGA